MGEIGRDVGHVGGRERIFWGFLGGVWACQRWIRAWMWEKISEKGLTYPRPGYTFMSSGQTDTKQKLKNGSGTGGQ